MTFGEACAELMTVHTKAAAVAAVGSTAFDVVSARMSVLSGRQGSLTPGEVEELKIVKRAHWQVLHQAAAWCPPRAPSPEYVAAAAAPVRRHYYDHLGHRADPRPYKPLAADVYPAGAGLALDLQPEWAIENLSPCGREWGHANFLDTLTGRLHRVNFPPWLSIASGADAPYVAWALSPSCVRTCACRRKALVAGQIPGLDLDCEGDRFLIERVVDVNRPELILYSEVYDEETLAAALMVGWDGDE